MFLIKIKECSMKLLKKITILLCFLSLIAFVSCSAEDKSGVKEKDNTDGTEITGGGKSGTSGTGGSAGTGGGEKTFASYAGTWYGNMDGSGEKPLILINSDGSFKILGGDINVPSSDITKNSDTSYTASQGSESITFNFSSDTQGTVDFGYGKDGILTITKH